MKDTNTQRTRLKTFTEVFRKQKERYETKQQNDHKINKNS